MKLHSHKAGQNQLLTRFANFGRINPAFYGYLCLFDKLLYLSNVFFVLNHDYKCPLLSPVDRQPNHHAVRYPAHAGIYLHTVFLDVLFFLQYHHIHCLFVHLFHACFSPPFGHKKSPFRRGLVKFYIILIKPCLPLL